MKYKLIIIAGLIFGQCLQAQSDKELVNGYLRYAFSGNWESQRKLMSDDIIDYHPTILEKPANGQKALLEGWKATVSIFDSLKTKTVAESELSILEGELTGEWVLNITEVTAHASDVEKPIRFIMVGLYQLNNGLIREVRNFGNLMDLYLQMGYQIIPAR